MPTWRQMSLAGNAGIGLLQRRDVCVPVNLDVRMEPPGWETTPECSTYAVCQAGELTGSLRYIVRMI